MKSEGKMFRTSFERGAPRNRRPAPWASPSALASWLFKSLLRHEILDLPRECQPFVQSFAQAREHKKLFKMEREMSLHQQIAQAEQMISYYKNHIKMLKSAEERKKVIAAHYAQLNRTLERY
jgi:hypothetical protein